jgi:ABC-2 type transport system ATP-binding protein
MLSLTNVSMIFKQRRRAPIKALDDVTFRVAEGEFFALLGENGAGKSTAMHCMLGLTRPTRGSVSLLGRTPERGSEVYQVVGYLPEEPHYYPSYLTIGETIDYYARLFRRVLPAAERLALLERLGLAEFRDLRIGKCSKGMKQKVGIAQCLLGEPRLLFLDEPMRGLDPVGVRDFRQILIDLNRRGCTIVMNSHILAEVESVATSVAILKRGRLIAHDRLENLAGDEDRFDVEFEGDPFDYLTVVERHGENVRATLPPDRLPQFLAAAAAGSIRLHTFHRTHRSLEETFLSLVGQETPHA